MEKKFIKEYYAKNNYEKYFHRQYTQSSYQCRICNTPDFRRKNNTKKIRHKLKERDRNEKYNYNIKIIKD